MVWKCPACQTSIRHNEVEVRPLPEKVYRCPICRLELVFDGHSETMTVTPMRDDVDGTKARRTS
jgi:hypothetical protein